MDEWKVEAAEAPRNARPLDGILREAAREFDAPIALLSRDGERTPRPGLAPQACAPVTSASGEHLGSLCVLGLSARNSLSATKLARLHELAAQAAAALDGQASA